MTASILICRRTFAAAALLLAVALGGCETTGGGPSAQAAAPPPEPMTHQQAALECWMAQEKTAAKVDLDKRADLVNKCIAQKMSGATASDTTAAAKPDAGPKAGAAPKPKT